MDRNSTNYTYGISEAPLIPWNNVNVSDSGKSKFLSVISHILLALIRQPSSPWGNKSVRYP